MPEKKLRIGTRMVKGWMLFGRQKKKKKKKMQTIAIAIQTKNCFKVKQRSIFGSFVEIKNALIKFFIGDYQVYTAATRK